MENNYVHQTFNSDDLKLKSPVDSSKSAKTTGKISQSIKDLSFALFMGATLDAKYKNIFIAGRNRKIVEFFSRPISQVNK